MLVLLGVEAKLILTSKARVRRVLASSILQLQVMKMGITKKKKIKYVKWEFKA
jgi:hypothetical protein